MLPCRVILSVYHRVWRYALLLITDRHGQSHFHILSARQTAIRHVLRSGKVVHLGSCVKSIGTRLQLSIWL